MKVAGSNSKERHPYQLQVKVSSLLPEIWKRYKPK